MDPEVVEYDADVVEEMSGSEFVQPYLKLLNVDRLLEGHH